MEKYNAIFETMAFSVEKINTLNKTISSIDDRFFLFTDVRLHNLSNILCFNNIFTTGMINMYNMSYDCGPLTTFQIPIA